MSIIEARYGGVLVPKMVDEPELNQLIKTCLEPAMVDVEGMVIIYEQINAEGGDMGAFLEAMLVLFANEGLSIGNGRTNHKENYAQILEREEELRLVMLEGVDLESMAKH